ncbi:hypothetical protein GCM10025864_35890 [Luteimicrobium album]|uniref:Uncharacterized protein n=1 Tax=Luteimicrobium album TaxID=1054550 RepID=A0ABQ6I7W1_9MICO|nr:hypothetical protein [Luteimicrobium album]GMA25830.1 hypothetical protein GCM10025864_35890 [Luteimicrobium album]
MGGRGRPADGRAPGVRRRGRRRCPLPWGARGARLTWVDGEPGLAWVAGDEVKVAFAFQVVGGHVREIELIADPEVLATMSLVVD